MACTAMPDMRWKANLLPPNAFVTASTSSSTCCFLLSTALLIRKAASTPFSFIDTTPRFKEVSVAPATLRLYSFNPFGHAVRYPTTFCVVSFENTTIFSIFFSFCFYSQAWFFSHEFRIPYTPPCPGSWPGSLRQSSGAATG